MMRDDPRHGTYAGHCTHQRDGEKDCEPCRVAYNEYHRQWRANPDTRAEDRRRNAARSRALWRLAAEHPEDFQRLYLDEIGPPLLEATR